MLAIEDGGNCGGGKLRLLWCCLSPAHNSVSNPSSPTIYVLDLFLLAVFNVLAEKDRNHLREVFHTVLPGEK